MTATKYLIVPHLNTKELIRIFSRITVNPVTGCWEHMELSRNQKGYGMISYDGRRELAHRLLYAWLIEPVPRGKGGHLQLELDHVVCNNPPCCNPIHVKLVTTKQNNLRGGSPAASNARKTHCVNGHLLPKQPNRCSKGKWRRRCLTCQRKVESRRPPRPYREKLRQCKTEETLVRDR